MKENMECRTIRQLLASDYLDDRLEPEARAQVDRHLAQCPACRQAHAEIMSVTRPLRQAQRTDAPPELWARVKAEIGRGHASRSGSGIGLKYNIFEIFMMRPVMAAAAAAVLIVAGAALFMLFPGGSSGVGSGAGAGVATTTDLNALTGNVDFRDQHSGFGSSIELLLM